MLSLVMNPGTLEESTCIVGPGTVTIGRTSDNAIVCEHKSLSRKHAQLDYDGRSIRVEDLQSKNGIFFNGSRVSSCQLVEGDSFRCGDVTFFIDCTTTRRPPVTSANERTLPSPLGPGGPPLHPRGEEMVLVDSESSPRLTSIPPSSVVLDEQQRQKEKLFLLIHASELLVGSKSLDDVLEELILLTVQVLDIDRIALLTLDEQTLEMKPKVLKTFASAAPRPYSKRVVDWVVDNGSATSLSDVSRDQTLPGDARQDSGVRAAMAVPINPGGGIIGVLYADSVSVSDAFKPDDLALLRALANIAAVAIDAEALRKNRLSANLVAPTAVPV